MHFRQNKVLNLFFLFFHPASSMEKFFKPSLIVDKWFTVEFNRVLSWGLSTGLSDGQPFSITPLTEMWFSWKCKMRGQGGPKFLLCYSKITLERACVKEAIYSQITSFSEKFKFIALLHSVSWHLKINHQVENNG